MCRWLAYSGSPLLIDDILYKPQHSLIAQSLHSTLGEIQRSCRAIGDHIARSYFHYAVGA